MTPFSDPLYYLILCEMLVVAIIDFRTRRIWHLWHFINIALFIVGLLFFTDRYQMSWSHWRFPLGMLGVGFVLYWVRLGGVRVMGGGDGKYLASIFLVVPSAYQLLYFEALLWTTILVASILLLFNIVKNFKFVVQSFLIKHFNYGTIFGSRFPYVPLMVLAWLWMGWRN